MKSFFLAAMAFGLLAAPAMAQDAIVDKVRNLEAGQANIAKILGQIDQRLANLEKAAAGGVTPGITPVAPVVPVMPVVKVVKVAGSCAGCSGGPAATLMLLPCQNMTYSVRVSNGIGLTPVRTGFFARRRAARGC